MNSIIGFSELLKADVYGELDDAQRGGVSEILKSGEQLLDQIDDVLDVARLTNGTMDLDWEIHSVNDIAEICLSRAKGHASEKNLQLRDDIEDSIKLLTDERRLTQIIENLLHNAIKYTPENGVIRLHAQKLATDEVVIEVSDTGVGIEKETQERLFHPLREADQDLSESHGSAGLGLTIVQELAKLHGGRVELESSPGRGSCFSVYLPKNRKLRATRPGPITPPPRPPRQSHCKSSKVLLVEDNDFSLIPIRSFLENNRHQVRITDHPTDALQIVSEQETDLVVLDANCDGVDLEQAKALSKVTPLIVLTETEFPLDSELTNLSSCRMLSKPISSDQLEDTMEKLLSA